MRPIRTVAALAALFESLGKLLSSHRAVARVSIAALSFTSIIAFSQQAPVTRAEPEPATVAPASLLPQNVGIGVPTDAAITIDFDASMNPGSVEAALNVLPTEAVETSWSPELDQLTLIPAQRWDTDATYLVVVGTPRSARMARRSTDPIDTRSVPRPRPVSRTSRFAWSSRRSSIPMPTSRRKPRRFRPRARRRRLRTCSRRQRRPPR